MHLQGIIDFALGIDDNRACRDIEFAKALQSLDPTERCIHVEFPDEFNNQKYAIIWRSSVWRAGPAERTEKMRRAQQHNAQVAAVREAKLRQLVDAMILETGLKQEQVIELAYKMLSRKSKAAFLAFGVTIDDIPDGVWQEFLMKRLKK